MPLFYTDRFVLPLPAGHRFPMAKYRLLRERVVASGLVRPGELVEPPAATDDDLRLAHDADYVAAMSAGRVSAADMQRIGFPWSAGLVERSRRSSGATIEACRAAVAGGVGVNLAGGTHHAFRDHGEGFCLFNDSVVAARRMQRDGRAKRVLVIDLDVHQGNGTAAICRGDPSVFTLSVHAATNYPRRKERSDRDAELPDGAGDEAYLAACEAAVPRAVADGKPDLAIYLAGADPFAGDKLGRLAVSKVGLGERDRLVFDVCRRAGVPVAVSMAGGYAADIHDTVDIQWATVRRALGASIG